MVANPERICDMCNKPSNKVMISISMDAWKHAVICEDCWSEYQYEVEPERACGKCGKILGKWTIAYPMDPGERGVLCVMCWRDRLGFKRFSFNPTSSGAGASR
jgi:hypothetical protein